DSVRTGVRAVAEREPPAVDEEHRAVVETQRNQLLEPRLAASHPVAHEHLLVGEVLTVQGHGRPLVVVGPRGEAVQHLVDWTRRRIVVLLDALDLIDGLTAACPLPPRQQAARDREYQRQGEVRAPPAPARERGARRG